MVNWNLLNKGCMESGSWRALEQDGKFLFVLYGLCVALLEGGHWMSYSIHLFVHSLNKYLLST